MNDPSDPNGAYDISSLDLSDVQRIEVLEGPQSSLWGSAAIGGVISLTTEELNGWRARGEGGSLNSFDGSAAFGRRAQDDTWAFGASIFGDRSDGVAKADGIGPRNAYWSASGGAWGRVTPADWLTLDAHLRYQRSYAAIDGYDANTFAFGYTPQYYRTEGWSGIARAIVQAPLGFTDTVSYGVYDLRRTDDYTGQPFSSSRYTARTQDWRFTAERGTADDPWGVEFGAERQNTHGLLSTGENEGLGDTSGFAVLRFRPLEPLTISASARYDAPDNFAGSATGHVAAVLKLPAGFQLEGAWGQGFKTPTISEIACDFCFPGGPSLNLRPEHAQGWDGALAWASDDHRLTARLTGYRLAVNDQIAFSPSFPFRYVNLSHTRSTGLEAQASADLGGGFTLSAEYAYTDAIDVDARTQLLRVPRNAGSATLGWTGGRWTASFTLRGEGPDADENPSTFAPQRRPGFVTADAAASYALTPSLDLTARVTDLSNKRYEEVLGYGEPRQMFFIGLRAKG
jgi:vitamin B12 transporter